jgi:hypothetical protein
MSQRMAMRIMGALLGLVEVFADERRYVQHLRVLLGRISLF